MSKVIPSTKWLYSTLQILLAGFILTIPLSPRWGNYCLIILGIIALILFQRERRIYVLPDYLYILIGLYLVRVIWLIPADDIRYGFRTLETELPILAIPLLFTFVNVDTKLRLLLMNTFILMAFLIMVYSFGSLLLYVATSEYTVWNYWETHFVTAQYYSMLNMLSWSYVHYSFLSLIILYGLNLVIYRQDKSGPFKAFGWIYALLAMAFVVTAGSVAGVAIMILCYLTYFLIWIYKAFGLRTLAVMILIGGIVSVLLLARFNVKEQFFRLDPQRYYLFSVAWETWKERPMFGYGTGAQKAIMQDMGNAAALGIPAADYTGPLVNHPHNQFLTELLQFGLIGSVPLFFFLGSALRTSVREGNWILVVTVLTLAASMLVESPISSNKGAVPFVLLLCILPNRSKSHALSRNG